MYTPPKKIPLTVDLVASLVTDLEHLDAVLRSDPEKTKEMGLENFLSDRWPASQELTNRLDQETKR